MLAPSNNNPFIPPRVNATGKGFHLTFQPDTFTNALRSSLTSCSTCRLQRNIWATFARTKLPVHNTLLVGPSVERNVYSICVNSANIHL